MNSMINKEFKLSASPLAYLFMLAGFMFMIPGYPVLCGAFFATLGIFQSFQYAREANDTVFSALLPIAKKDVVKGRFIFTCIIEAGSFAIMTLCTLARMTLLSGASAYRENALMNANPFALGAALVIFGLFNAIFVCGFYRTAYKFAKPFVINIVSCFAVIIVAETLHHIPGLEALNSFGFDGIGLQLACFCAGACAYAALTLWAFKRAKAYFEKIDL